MLPTSLLDLALVRGGSSQCMFGVGLGGVVGGLWGTALTHYASSRFALAHKVIGAVSGGGAVYAFSGQCNPER